MNKTFLFATRKYLTVAVAAVLLSAAAAPARANFTSGKTSGANITYIGTENNLMVFNVQYSNPTAAKVVVELLDETGTSVYRRTFSDKQIDKNILLKHAGEKCTVSFRVLSADETYNQRFELEPATRVISETVVTKL